MNTIESGLSELIEFASLLPEDIKIIAPTTFSKLNLAHYCQALKTFRALSLPNTVDCAHKQTVNTKIEIIKQVISRIIDTESVFILADRQSAQ